MIRGILHFNVVCTDLDRSMKFYGDILGGNVLGDTRLAAAERQVDTTGAGIAMGFEETPEWRACYIRFGDDENATVIDLLQWIKPAPIGKPHEKMNQVGIPRVALAVDDIDKIYNDLKAKGVEFISPPQVIDLERPGQAPIKVVCFKDPDGTVLEFSERP